MSSTPIVSADALASRIDRVRWLDCRSGPGARDAYLARHVRGALFADLERDLSRASERPDRGGRHPLPALDAWAVTLGRWGVDPGTTVVVYDDKGGANAAARAWWMLRASRHAEVLVLDGGLAAAERAGLPFASGEETVEAREPYPVRSWSRPTVDLEEVERVVLDPTRLLVDVRAPERYRGEVEPFDPVAGHIPGALNVPLTESLTPEGTFRSPDALRALFLARFGGVPVERVVMSCGSGVTACHSLLALEHAGLSAGEADAATQTGGGSDSPGAKGPALFVGSWSEWCRSGRAPATGSAPRG